MHPGLQTVAVRGLAQPSSPLLIQGRGAGQGGAAGGWSEIWASGQPALRRAAAAGCLPPAAPRVPVPASPNTRAPARRPRPPTVPPLALAGLSAGGCEGPGRPGAPPCLPTPLAVAQPALVLGSVVLGLQGCAAEEEEAELAGWAARSGRWQPAHQGRCYVYPPTSWQLQLELWAANELLRQAGENARRALADLHTTNQRCEALRRQNLELQQA
ncbi:hypothetical protein HaLaN_18251 [Haematococcus lacustris]|uniref:Uncharacterized protein n=1 Tax=Haematococcus lacustris TaxID=44745 RepID=A0A699ZRI8_HAELA|nr:hypothetical protein HaLaN_18251 [Haematococcus lacustris]